MKKHNPAKEMVSTRKLLSCSTPEHCEDSPSRDSDSICDSESASPVPFLCTQDGAEGETDVVWNFYTPKSGNAAKARDKNSTPLSRKSKRSQIRPKSINKQIPRRRPVKPSQKKTELFQELFELNQNLQELIAKKQNSAPEKPQSGSEEDIFVESQDCSPKSIPRGTSRCLRKNVLSSNFGRPDPDAAIESDDSMNECLLKASQIVEEKMLKNDLVLPKKMKFERRPSLKTDLNLQMDQDSMDALINISMRLESPTISKVKKCESPNINNDSFDNLVGNLNESALEQLTTMPIMTDPCSVKDWTVKELVVHESSPSSKYFFGRHKTMPESPSVPDTNKPSTSGMVLGRYNSMPFNNEADKSVLGDSPIRCTPDEIKKKHQLAREKLMAKRLLPFTSTQQTQTLPSQLTQYTVSKKAQFQPKTASSNMNTRNNLATMSNTNLSKKIDSKPIDIKQLIEKKRQEALMKLRSRQPHNN